MKWENTNGARRMAAVLCMLSILFLSCPGALTVKAQGDAKLAASVVTAGRNSTVVVTVALEENPGIWGLKFKAGYDHSALTLQSVANGSVFEESDIVLPGSLDREQFVFVAARDELENITADGNIITLSFLVREDAAEGTYPITLELTQAINAAGEDIKMTVIDGSITINADDTDDGEPDRQAAEVKTAGTKTGDDSNPVLWIVILVAALAGGGIFCVLHMRRKNREH